ncbi:hypothetical protein C8R43DRAFT_940404 [Mycena crocata]|nr:hypothetical protein C8R43DRAFT_940404 [Mycena crocata]
MPCGQAGYEITWYTAYRMLGGKLYSPRADGQRLGGLNQRDSATNLATRKYKFGDYFRVPRFESTAVPIENSRRAIQVRSYPLWVSVLSRKEADTDRPQLSNGALKFSSLSNLFAFVVAAQAMGMASGAPASDNAGGAASENALISPSPAEFNVGIFCTNNNLSGSCPNINVNALPSTCFHVLAQFDNQISSLRVNAGVRCTFYTNSDCSGSSRSFTGTTLDLAGDVLQDSISGYQCFSMSEKSCSACNGMVQHVTFERLWSGSMAWRRGFEEL